MTPDASKVPVPAGSSRPTRPGCGGIAGLSDAEVDDLVKLAFFCGMHPAAFTAISVVLETIFALGVALMLHRRFRGRGLLRAAILIPWAPPTVVSATLWKTMSTRARDSAITCWARCAFRGAHTA